MIFHSIISAIILCTLKAAQGTIDSYKYCVVGAGPGGLQVAYFLHESKLDYIVLERASVPGSFFEKFPRHNKLISINKRHTGRQDSEFNFRHDWNALISDDESLLFKHFSKHYFPDRTELLTYLRTFRDRWQLRVKFGVDVWNITREQSLFILKDRHDDGARFECEVLIMANGMQRPVLPKSRGADLVTDYADASIDPDDYDGQRVMILGRGNAACEMASSLYGSTALIHMVARSRLRLAWATHYVGDVRAVNNEILDAYQLKSLDALVEFDVNQASFERRDNGLVYVGFTHPSQNHTDFGVFHGGARGYHKVISCLGFEYDDSLFHESLKPSRPKGRTGKFPAVTPSYESRDLPDSLYYAGINTHSVDHRRSAGGFIHGFRYTARALTRVLKWKHEDERWPHTRGHLSNLVNHLLRRVNRSSGLYQMFSVLADVVLVGHGTGTTSHREGDRRTSYTYLEEIPLRDLHRLPEITGWQHDGPIIVVQLVYGANFSQPGKDTMAPDRAQGQPRLAHLSNFLHPYLAYYDSWLHIADQPSEKENSWMGMSLPEPTREHHVLEDFLTEFTDLSDHVSPLRRFLQDCLNEQLQPWYAEDCMLQRLTAEQVPLWCDSSLDDQNVAQRTMMLTRKSNE